MSFAVLGFVCDNLWSSSVQKCRRAQAVSDFVSFAMLGVVCDSLWSASVQMCRRAQVVHDFLTYVDLAGPDVTRNAKGDVSINEVCLLSEDATDPARGRAKDTSE